MKVDHPKDFPPGSIVWLAKWPSGSYEVVATGKKEVLARRLSWWETIQRRWLGKLRRWWSRPRL